MEIIFGLHPVAQVAAVVMIGLFAIAVVFFFIMVIRSL